MEKVWLRRYPPGVAHEVRYDEFESVRDLFEASVKKFGDRPAYHNMGKSITFNDLDRMTRAFGAWLQANGFGKGTRVAIMMPNVLQYPVALFGTHRAGGIVVNVNPLYTARELEHQLKDSGAEVIVILENFAATLAQVLSRTSVKKVVVASLGDLLGFKGKIVNFVVRHVKKMVPAFELPDALRFNDVIADGARHELKPVALTHDDIAFLQYTGGTTGVAKGAMLLQRNLIANLLQCEAWFEPALHDTRRGPVPEQFTFVCALPLYHSFALTANGLLGLRLGAVNVLIANPRDIHQMVKDLRHHRFNTLPAVNTLLNALAEDPEFRKLDFSDLRITIGAGMAVHKAVADKWLALTGCPVVEAYGLTETSPAATCNPLLSTEWNATIGLPLPGTEIAILDEAGRAVPFGQPGEIAIRGPQVMAGYWQRPDETAKVMTPDGYFKSGDIGVMDERGHTRIVDRKKDMIIVSGFNVYPNEIEAVVTQHPGVLECAAVGVADERSGEAVKLFVVRKDPALTESGLMEYCRQQLTGYKRPKYVEFRAELPRTNVGKILRRALRETPEAAILKSA